MNSPNFNVPMGDSLLWVYEGQTQYWGYALTARAGLWTPQQFRDALLAVQEACEIVAGRGVAGRRIQALVQRLPPLELGRKGREVCSRSARALPTGAR